MGSSECQARQIYGPIWQEERKTGGRSKRKEGRKAAGSGKLVKPFPRADGWRSAHQIGRVEITPAGTPLVNIFQTIPRKLSGNSLFSPLPMSFSHFPSGARRFPPPLSASPLRGKALSGLIDWPTASARDPLRVLFHVNPLKLSEPDELSERKRVLGGCDAQLRHYGIY